MSLTQKRQLTITYDPGISVELKSFRPNPLPPEVPFVFVIIGMSGYWLIMLHWVCLKMDMF